MPEDTNPGFSDSEAEERLTYFTLPMSLNYQRDSYKLWEACKRTYQDRETKDVFSIQNSAKMKDTVLREKLLKYKVALQPNKHVQTWETISETIYKNWGSLSKLFLSADNDFLTLKEIVQKKKKKGFPYLSGPKIFHYWCFIMMEYGRIPLKNAEYIDIAPDTHIIKCSMRLNLLSEKDSETVSREEISKRWREALEGTGILPIQMHPPLWFWSRNNFSYNLDANE